MAGKGEDSGILTSTFIFCQLNLIWLEVCRECTYNILNVKWGLEYERNT